MSSKVGLATGLAVVLVSMLALFAVPKAFFVAATIVSTTCMIGASLAAGGYRRLFAPSVKTLAFGLVSAALLYGLFYFGNLGIRIVQPFGIGPSSEGSIYSLIASPANPLYLQLGVLAFDSVGYESYFRGVLQKRAQPRLGVAAPFAVAAADSAIHILTLNPLWVVTTFIADSVWGLTYYYAKDLSASLASHLLWDIAIFIILPIR